MKDSFYTSIPAERRILMAFMSGGLLIILLMMFAVAPSKMPFPECIFRSITGHSCLTCGLTRSLHAISHGHLITSVRYHLFGPAVFGALLLCFGIFGAEAISGRKVLSPIRGKIGNGLIPAFAVSWVLYWILRLILEFSGHS